MKVYIWDPAFSILHYILRSETAVSYGKSIFNFLWKMPVLQSSCIILHYYQQCTRFPISPHPRQYLLFLGFFESSHLKWYLLVVLTWISVMISDTEHLFMCQLALSKSSLVECLLKVLCPFLKSIFFLLLSYSGSWYVLIVTPFNIWFTNIFSPSIACLFTLFTMSFDAYKFFILMWSNLPIFYFCCLCFWGHLQKVLTKSKIMKLPSYVFLLRIFIVLGLIV